MSDRPPDAPGQDPLDGNRFEEVDRQFARFLLRLTARTEPGLALAAALASAETRQGHVCLDLAAAADPTGDPAEGAPDACDSIPPLAEWLPLIAGWQAVGSPGDGEDAFRPLILDSSNRLYLHRYWKYERELAGSLLERAVRPGAAGGCESDIDRLFPPLPGGEPDDQRLAAETAIRHGVTLITGGPGTGKTTTVVKIISLLAAHDATRRIDIAMAAPTGKAAARLKEAVESARASMAGDPSIGAAIPSEATTLHRLLGAVPGSVRFRRGPDNPLPHDVVIVDEASMIDLPMMARLVGALSPGARLILLGDRDQLSSVEPGKVFGDLCDTSGGNRLKDSVVVLRKSWRFDEKSGIGALARLVNDGRGEPALELAGSGRFDDVAWHPLSEDPESVRSLEESMLDGYAPYLRLEGIAARFEAFQRFRVLCALRHGRFGVEGANALAESVLSRAGLIRPRGPVYEGRPVMVTRNDYRIRLYNGDIGLLLRDPDAGGAIRAFFPSGDGGYRAVSPSRLPEHVTAWAMTVHKSQGSEFDRVLLLLGTRQAGVLTRELLYTGVTRARRAVDMWGGRDVFLAASARKTFRRSGLGDALSGR